ncbi:MAG: hypothetical protein FJ125_01670 [Deltaproteobacteria bacterium]|nr:hypothetical protein [Deltaproteobacteria bacterium]
MQHDRKPHRRVTRFCFREIEGQAHPLVELEDFFDEQLVASVVHVLHYDSGSTHCRRRAARRQEEAVRHRQDGIAGQARASDTSGYGAAEREEGR